MITKDTKFFLGCFGIVANCLLAFFSPVPDIHLFSSIMFLIYAAANLGPDKAGPPS
jgi:hypothetical protein